MARQTNTTVKTRVEADLVTLRASRDVANAGGFRIIAQAYDRAIGEFLTGAINGDLNTVGVDQSAVRR